MNLQLTEANDELRRNMSKQIDRAAGGLSADAGGNIDSVTKAQVERLRQSVDQMEGSLEDLRRATNTKLAE